MVNSAALPQQVGTGLASSSIAVVGHESVDGLKMRGGSASSSDPVKVGAEQLEQPRHCGLQDAVQAVLKALAPELGARLPTSLADFWREDPAMLVLPALTFAALFALNAAFWEALEAEGMQPWGWDAVHFTAFAVLCSYAYHGYACAHQGDLKGLKIQPSQAYKTECAGHAVRSTAVLLTELVYTALPMRLGSTGHSPADWARSVALFVLLKVFMDAWFFTVHKVVHRVAPLYKLVHKLHHTVHAPNCFGAYFVTYYSHFLVEHLPMAIAALVLRFPKDVLVFYLYVGAFGFFTDHSGIHMGEVELPLPCVSLTLGQVLAAINFEGALFGGVEAATHDFHHEQVKWNFALHYTYLDRIFGVFKRGRAQQRD